MKLILEKEEIVELTELIKALRHSRVTSVWNHIFGNDRPPEIALEVADQISVTISKDISLPVLMELKKHGNSFGTLLQSGFSLSVLSRWKRAIAEFGADMSLACRKLRKK